MTNAKFFYSRDNKGDIRNVGNPNQGTYLYKSVTYNEEEEFYLVS